MFNVFVSGFVFLFSISSRFDGGRMQNFVYLVLSNLNYLFYGKIFFFLKFSTEIKLHLFENIFEDTM